MGWGSMNRVARSLLSVGAFCATAASLSAQGKFPLDSKPVTLDDLNSPFLRMACEWVSAQEEKPEEVKRTPANLPEGVSYFVGQVGGTPLVMLTTPAKPPVLYIDTNLDGDLSDEKPITGKRMKSSEFLGWSAGYSFGTVPAPQSRPAGNPASPAKAAANMQVTVMNGMYAVIAPVSYRSGQIQVGKKKYQVRLVDSNYDGRYDGTVRFTRNDYRAMKADCLVVDRNGDGEFEASYDKDAEVFPLPKMLSFGDTYYSIQVAIDGSSITLEKTAPKFGTLDVGQADTELLLWSESGIHQLKGSNGKWKLPAGRYSCWSLSLSRKDQKKNKWTLFCRGQTGKLLDFEVEPDKVTSFKLGPPLTLEPTVKIGRVLFRRTATVSATAVGQSGEQYLAGAQKNEEMQPAPTIKFVDASGKTIESGKLEYG
jgi:hypothetical protein